MKTQNTPKTMEQKVTPADAKAVADKKRTKSSLKLCFLAFLLLSVPTLLAEEVVVESDLEVEGNVTVTGDDGVVFFGSSSGDIPVEGVGRRMMWYPGKAAFRAGEAAGTEWDDSNVGSYSFAMGYHTTASGSYSVAMGFDTTASGNYSMAMGEFATASESYSIAMGVDTTASGWASTAMGEGASASGYASTAMGVETLADSYASVAIGRYNIGGGDPNWWGEEDPLFEIGNGTDSQNPSNALTVYKNGDMEVDGTVRVQPSGDISMGQFTD